MRPCLSRHLCTSERQRRCLSPWRRQPGCFREKIRGAVWGEKARARGLPVARGNKWSGREPGPLCRGAESTRVRPARRLTKPTSIDRMKIEPMKHGVVVERRTGTWPRTHTHTPENTVCKLILVSLIFSSYIYEKRTCTKTACVVGIKNKLQMPIIFLYHFGLETKCAY